MGRYFCGWYYRCQSDTQTLAVIPSIHKTRGHNFCMIQLISDENAFHAQFPYYRYHKRDSEIRIGSSHFSNAGISLDIHSAKLRAEGTISFGAFTPIHYDIMGPFQYVPFLQCRHSVLSMRHRVDGEIRINRTPTMLTGFSRGNVDRLF